MINYGVKCKGQYKIVVTDGMTGEVKSDTDWFDNILTDNLFADLSTQTDLFALTAFMVVGTGSNPPAFTDNALQNQVGSQQSSTSQDENNTSDANNTYTYRVYNAVWPLGAIVGNITEIGAWISPSGSSSRLHSRTLVKDLSGNPTAIPVTSGDQLSVFYRFINIFPRADVVNVIPTSFGSVTVTMRQNSYVTFVTASREGSSSFREFMTLEPVGQNGVASGGSQNFSSASSETPGGTGERIYSWDLSTSQGNFASGIGGLGGSLNNHLGYQVTFSPSIPKTSNDTLSISFKKTYARA